VALIFDFNKQSTAREPIGLLFLLRKNKRKARVLKMLLLFLRSKNNNNQEDFKEHTSRDTKIFDKRYKKKAACVPSSKIRATIKDTSSLRFSFPRLVSLHWFFKRNGSSKGYVLVFFKR